MSSLFCDYSNVIRFCQVFMTFSSFFGRKMLQNTQTSMLHCLRPGFPVADTSRGATRPCRQHLPNLLWILVSKTIKPKIKICHFISFIISFHLTSVLFIAFYSLIHSFLPSFLPSFLHSFIHSFIHTCHGCACQASLSSGVRSSVNAVPQRHFGPPDVLMFFYFVLFCVSKKRYSDLEFRYSQICRYSIRQFVSYKSQSNNSAVLQIVK